MEQSNRPFTLSRLVHRTSFERNIQIEFPQLTQRWPTCGGRPVDLYYLYQLVLSHGGYKFFHGQRLWQSYTQAHGVPKSCTSSGSQLSKIYKKYLLSFEKRYQESKILKQLSSRKVVCIVN